MVTVLAVIVCAIVIFGKETSAGGDFNRSDFQEAIDENKKDEDKPTTVDVYTPYVPPKKTDE